MVQWDAAESVMEGPVGLLVVESSGRWHASTIPFFSEVAHHPTTLWVSLASNSHACQLVEEGGHFSLIVLHEGQKNMARACQSVHEGIQLPLQRTSDGFCQLADSIASANCRVRSKHVVGDHTLFIAEILSGQVDSRNTLKRHLLSSDL